MALLTSTKPLVAAALTRVSRKVNGGTSPAQQWDRAQQVTEVDGLPVLLTEEYREEQSASRFGKKLRTRFAALIKDIEENRYDLIILWEVDRGARETEIWSRFLNVCRSTGTLVHVITHRRTYDVRNGRDWRALMEDGVDAAYFSEKLSVNIRRGHNASRNDGKPGGRAPYGYTRVYDSSRKLARIDGVWQQVPNDDAPVVREIIERIAAQVPLNVVQRDLSAKGIDIPRTTIRAVASCPAYANLRSDGNGGYVAGRWVPIVDEATWRRAKAVLDSQGGTNPGHTVWLLSSIGSCACGASGSWKGQQTNVKVHTASYFCRSCGTKINAEQADQHVTALAIGRMSQPDAAQFLIKDTSEEANAARLEVQRLEDKLARHRDRLESAVDADEEDEEREQIRRLKPRIKAGKERAEKLSTPPALADFADALGNFDAVYDRWEAASLPARKAVLRVVFEEITLHRSAKRGQPAEDRISHRFAG